MELFSIRAALKEGWNIFKTRWIFYIAVAVVPYAVVWMAGMFFQIIGAPVQQLTENAPNNIGLASAAGLLGAAQGLITWILSMIFSVGVIGIYLDAVDGKNPVLSDLLSRKHLFIKYAIGNLLYGLAVGLGLLFFIVPGIYFAMRFYFWGTVLVDTNGGLLDAFRKSSELTRGIKMKLFVFTLVSAALGILGMLVFFVGILVVTPVVTLAATKIYRNRNPRVS